MCFNYMALAILIFIYLPIYLFIYLRFYVAFNTVQVISRWVVGRAEETSTYSSSGFCLVNCRPTASNYQLSHLRPFLNHTPASEVGGESVTTRPPWPLHSKQYSIETVHTCHGSVVHSIETVHTCHKSGVHSIEIGQCTSEAPAAINLIISLYLKCTNPFVIASLHAIFQRLQHQSVN